MTWEHLLNLASIVIAAVAVVISFRKSSHETRSLDGDAANKYATASGIVADQNIELRTDMKKLEERIETLEQENKELKVAMDSLKRENAGLREWAECLCGQVKKLGGNPVKLNAGMAKK